MDIDSAPPVAPNGETAATMALENEPDTSVQVVSGKEEKKRKSREGETPEERAERKRRKAEKKEKKAKKKSKAAAAEEDSESD
jgi:H/ACA ribonucleoprotein complex subunit 4